MNARERFGTMITMLCECFNRPLSEGLLDGYWMALESLSEAELKKACGNAMVNCKFMPSAAELLAFARPTKAPNVDAIQAWRVVRKAIDKHDYLVASIDFGHLVNAVIHNLGGWDTMCKATLPELDNPGWLRKRFEEIYKALSTAEPTTLHGDPLAGALPPKYINGKHITVSLDGKPDQLRLEADGASDTRASIQAHIRGLADDKAAE